jgi:mRNA interferase RelE/StbE
VSFEVRFSQRAVKDLKALPPAEQARILRKLEAASKEPLRYFRRLKGAKTHRLRVGDYRVLADIDAAKRHLDVVHVGHRRNVYD